MIEAVIFDLDGTLVQTERLKALSYARAAVELRPDDLTESEVVEAFKEVVGLSRQEVAEALLQRFDLESAARDRMARYDVTKPWQAYVQRRLEIYEELLSDSEILSEHQCPYNTAFLEFAIEQQFRTGLATMSRCAQAMRVLRLLHLKDKFDFIASQDDVENGKPDPEIYHLVAGQLESIPERCLVIEDSPAGVNAALNAGMHCIVVTTDFTRKAIHESGLLDQRWIVDDPSQLQSVAQELLEKGKR